MFTIWMLIYISTAYSLDIESTTASPNITTLYPKNKTTEANDSDSKPTTKHFPQRWKLETAFSPSNLTEVEAKTNGESKEEVKKKEDFKPSPHLGNFFDDDAAEVIKTPISGAVLKKPASGFVSSIRDEHRPTFNKIPKGIYQSHKQFPYKFEDPIFAKAKPNWYEDPLESKPTVESPFSIPAGGFYKQPGAFKEKPNSDEEFGLENNDEGKENALKKRENPWQNLLRLMTAFIPVGLIISALTPAVITIQNVDDNREPTPGIYRRSDAPAAADLTPISERCRRRLLCELQSDAHYAPQLSQSRRHKKCYKLQCEDTDALWRMLRWLFSYNLPQDHERRSHRTET